MSVSSISYLDVSSYRSKTLLARSSHLLLDVLLNSVGSLGPDTLKVK